MPSNPYESPDSYEKPSPDRPQSTTRRDWILLTGNILFGLAFVPVAVMLYEYFTMNAATDVVRAGQQAYFWMVAAACLATVAAVLIGVARFKSLRKAAKGAQEIANR